MAVAAVQTGERRLQPRAAIDELVSHLDGGPVVLESDGRAVAVLIDVDKYRDMQAVYEWHQMVLQERRAS
jgi:hypothetical protein